jgi:hypothetical protein
MQRTDPDGIVLMCDFCRRDWDGQEPMIEGHAGSIICLPCLQLALNNRVADKVFGNNGPYPDDEGTKFQCTLCLKFNIPSSVEHWSHPGQSPTEEMIKTGSAPLICRDCIFQSAGTFSKSPLTDWEFERAKYP